MGLTGNHHAACIGCGCTDLGPEIFPAMTQPPTLPCIGILRCSFCAARGRLLCTGTAGPSNQGDSRSNK
jgi:hypothetical protein